MLDEVAPTVRPPRSGFATARAALADGADPVALALDAADRAQAAAGDGIFTALVPRAEVEMKAAAATARARAGEALPLFGLTFSVKDNLHVAGMTTTLNCPAVAMAPQESALAITRLEAAGAVLIGKNTLDQFATGLNGTRSPEPLCRNALDPAFIPGGSSSGSGVAVAAGLVSFSLGSDTGGSGRVPAACNGIVGLRPSLGLVSMRGAVYNSRLLDCIPIFATNVDDACGMGRWAPTPISSLPWTCAPSRCRAPPRARACLRLSASSGLPGRMAWWRGLPGSFRALPELMHS